MDNIPAIGGAKGIFEIFVPGVFLLLNLVAAIYKFPLTDDDTRDLIKAGVSNPVIGVVVTICFGYLIGILLRLLGAELLDKLSSAWLRRFEPGARHTDGSFELWVLEEFPYLGWMGEACNLYLPPKVLDFYNKTWGRRKRDGHNNRFFNFCKVLVNSVDEQSAPEIHFTEALSRYLIGMFYSLGIASFLIFLTLIFEYVDAGEIIGSFLVLLIAYVLAIGVILNNFRKIRLREVFTVFDANFRNRELLEAELTDPVETPKLRPVRSSRPHRS